MNQCEKCDSFILDKYNNRSDLKTFFLCNDCYKKASIISDLAVSHWINEYKKDCQSKCKLCDAREEWNKE